MKRSRDKDLQERSKKSKDLQKRKMVAWPIRLFQCWMFGNHSFSQRIGLMIDGWKGIPVADRSMQFVRGSFSAIRDRFPFSMPWNAETKDRWLRTEIRQSIVFPFVSGLPGFLALSLSPFRDVLRSPFVFPLLRTRSFFSFL